MKSIDQKHAINLRVQFDTMIEHGEKFHPNQAELYQAEILLSNIPVSYKQVLTDRLRLLV